MSGFWAVFWLAVVLKIPIGLLLYIVWWAAKDPPRPGPATTATAARAATGITRASGPRSHRAAGRTRIRLHRLPRVYAWPARALAPDDSQRPR